MITALSAIASGRTPKSSVKSHDSATPSIGIEMRNKPSLRTQTYQVRGYDKLGKRVETRIAAPSKDHAIGIAHERGIRVAECVQMKN